MNINQGCPIFNEDSSVNVSLQGGAAQIFNAKTYVCVGARGKTATPSMIENFTRFPRSV